MFKSWLRNVPQKFSLLFNINFIITGLVFLLFLSFNHGYTVLSFLFTFVAAISSAIILYVVILAILYPLTFFPRIVLWVTVPLFAFLHLGMVIDYFLFRLYRFHINGMVLNTIFSPDALDSFDVGISAKITIIAVIIISILLQVGIIKYGSDLFNGRLVVWNRKFNRFKIPVWFIIVLLDKLVFITADIYGKTEFISRPRVIPFYQAIVATRWAEEKFSLQRSTLHDYQKSSSKEMNLKYPLKPIKLKKLRKLKNSKEIKSLPNILFIVADAFRGGMISKEITPFLNDFAPKALWFTNHHSGGNATRYGLFSLLYGLNSSYWDNFLIERKPSVFIQTLLELKYQMYIGSSTRLTWPEFRQTAFSKVPEELIYDNYEGHYWQRDLQSSKEMLSHLDKLSSLKTNPFFYFLFLDAPHQSSYPSTHAKFKGGKKTSYLAIDKEKDKDNLLNHYKNSLYFTDEVIGKVVKTFEKRGLLDNTIIIITADHGEEFFESGNFGHNTAFSKQQIRTLMLMQIPRIGPQKISKLTAHVDLVPTLMNLLGVENSEEDYSVGHDLLSPHYQRQYVFASNWNWYALLAHNSVLVFSKYPDVMMGTTVHDYNTYEIRESDNQKLVGGYLLKILDENRRFLY